MCNIKFARKDSVTGKGINQGYCYNDGEKYFKNESDLIQHLRLNGDEEYNKASDEFILKEAYEEDLYYWTDWEIEDGENWYSENGEEHTDCYNCGELTPVSEDFAFCKHCLTHL